jgi:hypothetical protein
MSSSFKDFESFGTTNTKTKKLTKGHSRFIVELTVSLFLIRFDEVATFRHDRQTFASPGGRNL